jgi:hypothetical protein
MNQEFRPINAGPLFKFTLAVSFQVACENKGWEEGMRERLQQFQGEMILDSTGGVAVRSSFGSEEENTACIQTDRNHKCGLAHVSTFGWNDANGDG